MTIRKAEEKDIKAITAIWNEIVREGNAFPQDKELSEEDAYSFFSSQSFTAVASQMMKVQSWVCTSFIRIMSEGVVI